MWLNGINDKYSVEEKLSPEYHKLYKALWDKYKVINLSDKSTWEHIPDDEFHIMVMEPPLKEYKYRANGVQSSFIDIG